MSTKRAHRLAGWSVRCPRCGFDEEPTFSFTQDPITRKSTRHLSHSVKRCPKCAWENRSVSRRGAKPYEGASGDHKTKLWKQKQKRARRNIKKGLDRLIKAVIYAAKQTI